MGGTRRAWVSKLVAVQARGLVFESAPVGSELRSHFLLGESLDHVAGLDVLEALQTDAAVEAVAHLADVILEAAQRSDAGV